MLKKITALISAVIIAAAAAVPAMAYDVVNLPARMTMAEALEIYNPSDITSATLSSVKDGMYISLTESEIQDFYNSASEIELTRRINPNPMRGITLNLHTSSGAVRCFNLSSGVQIGLYGSSNYVCYQMDDEDLKNFMYLDSMYKEDTAKQQGADVHLRTDYDFLKLPEDPWAVSPVQQAASRSLLPYELSSNYGGYISREQFCMLLSNFIAVTNGYASIDDYMRYNNQNYLLNYFTDCDGRDPSISILYSMGIVSGKSDGIFDPDACITRQEAAKMLTETASKFKYIQTNYNLVYDDNDLIAPWAEFYVKWVSDNGIMSGIDKTHFDPTGYYTRQQAIATVTRLFDVCQ